MTRRILELLLLLALGAAGYALVYKPYQERLQRQALLAAAAEQERQMAQAAKLPRDDEAFPPEGNIHRPPGSAWRAAEKAYYRSVLTKGHFEALVLPVEVQGRGFGRPIRSFMSAELAMLFAHAGHARVPDPYLVARVLGDGDRRIDLAEAFDLANAIGAKKIIAGYAGIVTKYAGRDVGHPMRLTLHLYERRDGERFDASFAPHQVNQLLVASERVKSRHFENAAYTGPTNVIDVYDAFLPGMAAFLGVPAMQSQGDKPVSRFEGTKLPASLTAIAEVPTEPARDAYYLQLLAALAPQTADRERERLTEKSLLAVLRMSPQSPDYRALKARALMNLGLRPAALAALGTPQSAEEKHLFAVLNGNLPSIRANRLDVPAGVRALIALLEENQVAAAYLQVDEKSQLSALAALKLPGPLWQYLATRAMADHELWKQFHNIELKQLLDRELPVEKFTAEEMLQGLAALGDVQKMESAAELSVLEHARKLRDAAAAQACCRPLAAVATRGDMLDLLEAIATDNLSRRARFLGEIQGSPAGALQYLQRFETVYKDHPDFVVARARAELALSNSAAGAEQDSLLRAAAGDAMNVLLWEQGQTRTSADALNLIAAMRRPALDDVITANPYAYNQDYPYRPFYSPDASPGGDVTANARAALENSRTDLTALSYLEAVLGGNRLAEFDRILKTLEGRFQGNPDIVKALAQSAVRRGDPLAAQGYYEDAIRAQPASQDGYLELGRMLFLGGSSERARRVFMQFPGLKSGRENPVAVANYAYDAGSLFYWSGDFARAVPLYDIAAGLRTGSGSSLSSATRLALLRGDYGAALQASLERARRYNSPSAYGDYLGLLHALGYSKQAWQAFAILIQQIDYPELIWESALVGHRLERASAADIAAWLQHDPVRSAQSASRFGPMYFLRAALTDRSSSETVAQVDAVLPKEDVMDPATNAPRAMRSALAYYAQAHTALQAGRFQEARDVFWELHRLQGPPLIYMLPAYAYAALRSNHGEAVAELLAGVPPQQEQFDYHLTKAIVDGVAGRREQAMQHLALALARRKPLDFWSPLSPEYAYAEACEWLFETTRDARYREAAVDWARKNEKFQPWASWPYAVEARWTSDKAARQRAIAMAHYLDPDSQRLKAIPKPEITQAIKAFAGRNPFRKPAARGPKERV